MTGTHTPTVGAVTPERKRQSVKLDGSLKIRLNTVADSIGVNPEAMLDVAVEAACARAERRSKQDLAGFLGLDNDSESAS